MRTLTYSHLGDAVSDAKAEEYAARLATEDLHVSTENVVIAARAMVKEQKLPIPRLIFTDQNGKSQELTIDQNGRIEHWPPGFCDLFDRMLEKLV